MTDLRTGAVGSDLFERTVSFEGPFKAIQPGRQLAKGRIVEASPLNPSSASSKLPELSGGTK